MNKLIQYLKIANLSVLVIVFIFFSTSNAKNIDRFNKANNISDYLSGIVLLNDNRYGDSV